jgi:hypothetical protein
MKTSRCISLLRVSLRIRSVAQISQMLLNRLHFGFEVAQISFQLGYLLRFRLETTFKPVPGVAVTSTATTASTMVFTATAILT